MVDLPTRWVEQNCRFTARKDRHMGTMDTAKNIGEDLMGKAREAAG